MTARAIFFDQPVPYAQATHFQLDLHAERLADRIPDTVLFLEHRPVITLGRRGRDNFLLLSPDEYARRGIEVVRSTRGGDVTYHGPGQLVMYPILKLGTHEADAHGYMCNLEEIAIRTAASFGAQAYRRGGKNGAWTDAGKIAAIGFQLKRWVTLHGMSFNVDVDLAGFQAIVPCGLVGEPVASLRTVLGVGCPAMADVRNAMRRHFEDVCGRRLEPRNAR
jgi:lipoyl(octanoyl) transferase